jgi:hypothetical protein
VPHGKDERPHERSTTRKYEIHERKMENMGKIIDQVQKDTKNK